MIRRITLDGRAIYVNTASHVTWTNHDWRRREYTGRGHAYTRSYPGLSPEQSATQLIADERAGLENECMCSSCQELRSNDRHDERVANLLGDVSLRAELTEAKLRALRFEERVREVAESGCTAGMLEWSKADLREGLSCTPEDRCSACRCQAMLEMEVAR